MSALLRALSRLFVVPLAVQPPRDRFVLLVVGFSPIDDLRTRLGVGHGDSRPSMDAQDLSECRRTGIIRFRRACATFVSFFCAGLTLNIRLEGKKGSVWSSGARKWARSTVCCPPVRVTRPEVTRHGGASGTTRKGTKSDLWGIFDRVKRSRSVGTNLGAMVRVRLSPCFS